MDLQLKREVLPPHERMTHADYEGVHDAIAKERQQSKRVDVAIVVAVSLAGVALTLGFPLMVAIVSWWLS